ncbi:MAG: hypothetical protein CMF41_01760 [Legionellales bacterium]|nr:hypothetical protein [Legionellales bacterium]OUX65967.1 MAG: hypothetical protein CBE41_00970 [Gammaproteobacteria bacterium TMED281]
MYKKIFLSMVILCSIAHAQTDHSQDAFFDTMTIEAKESQTAILKERALIKSIEVTTTDAKELDWIEDIATKYRAKSCKIYNQSCKKELLEKVNVVPTSIALAQAGIESGYGKSRFAREGNSYFGQWCFTTGCGLRPINPNLSKPFFAVKSYPTKKDSIDDYMLNLNRHNAYKAFRAQRNLYLQDKASINTIPPTLKSYSRQGGRYVKKVQYMIRHYDLKRYD